VIALSLPLVWIPVISHLPENTDNPAK